MPAASIAMSSGKASGVAKMFEVPSGSIFETLLKSQINLLIAPSSEWVDWRMLGRG